MKGNKRTLAALTAALSLLLCSCTSTSSISAPHTRHPHRQIHPDGVLAVGLCGS